MSKTEKGFSLLELLIVVGIILIVAAIAIPSLLHSRQVANESAAVADLRLINTAEITYVTTSGGYFGNITQLISEGLLESRFSGRMSSYNFSISTNGLDYTATADPVSNTQARYGYYSTPEAVIRYSTSMTLAPSGQAGNPVH
jgi:prepilin-type N-terminal cleavage/methylation domain-containing protein